MKLLRNSNSFFSLLFLALLLTHCTNKQDNLSATDRINKDEDFSVEAELASFQVAKGYKVELFASEDIGLIKPTAMRWDELGRLWVLSIPGYPQLKPGEHPSDKLIILEDTDQDGKADTSIVYADSLNIPLGFELGNGGVYLGEQTRLLFLKDTDNDLKADSQETLLSGFGTHDLHQTINSFTWSPSGELFFCQGLSIYSRVETPWGVKKASRSAIWRYMPRLGKLDPFFDEAMASDNPWGLSFGDWGQLFIKSNNPDVYFGTPGIIVNSHKLMLPSIGSTSNKSGGLEIIRSTHFHDSLQNNLVVAGYYNNKVERMKLVEDGSGYSAELMEPLLTSSSRKFRPIEIKMGPDGAIYVLDWYNPIIGHYQASLRDPSRDKVHGRIWRISAMDRPLLQAPSLAYQSIPVLLDHLLSKEYWTKYQVRRLLTAMPVDQIQTALDNWVSGLTPSSPDYIPSLREAMFIYQSFEIVNEPLLKKLFTSANPSARGLAAQAVGRWAKRLEDPLKYLSVLINDPHPQVRLMAVVAAGNVQQPQSILVATQALNHATDTFIVYALEKAVHALKDYWGPALQNNKIAIGNKKHLSWVIAKAPPEWYTATAYRQLTDPLTTPLNDNGVALFKHLAKVAQQEDITYIIEKAKQFNHPALLDIIYENPQQQLSPAATDRLKNILESRGSAALKSAALRLVRNWDIRELATIATQILNDPHEDITVKTESVITYAAQHGQHALPLLKQYILTDNTSLAFKLACLKNISMFEVPFAANEALTLIKEANGQQEEIQQILLTIKADSNTLNNLATAIGQSGISKEEAQAVLRALKYTRVQNNNLSDAATKLAGKEWAANVREYNPQYLWGLEIGAAHTGDPINGKKVYDQLNCNTCHTINGKGGNIGPDLSAVGSGLSLKDIITEVLWPNINIKEGYLTSLITLKNGETIQGIKVLETPTSVSVKSIPSATPQVIDKSTIAHITEIGSVMPESLTNHISHGDLVDMLRYLSELRN